LKTILIVDDNMASLKQMSVQLADKYEVSLAKSGEMALQICAEEKPDLILLDVEMPDMDGFETIIRLKEDAHLRHIPVIFLTGNHDAATEIKCLKSGAMDFVTKPANVDILSDRIELHLQLSAYQLHLEKMVKELEDNIGITFAELLECKDYNVGNHVLRSAEFAGLLIRELFEAGIFGNEISAEDIDIMKRAVPFHDIGKIGISDTILRKQGPLTTEEREEINTHTIIGANMLRGIYARSPGQHYLKMAITIAEGHHERYDGNGYPHGLKGDDIPLCCRIMVVANVYDSYTSDRIYRKARSHEEACQKIFEGRGTEFDPRVVDAFGKVKGKFASLHISERESIIDKEWNFNYEPNFGC
jgi:putative two-component system response regulator